MYGTGRLGTIDLWLIAWLVYWVIHSHPQSFAWLIDWLTWLSPWNDQQKSSAKFQLWTEEMSLVIDRFTELTPYKQFYARYLKGNLPCILSSTFTANWPCVLHWTSADGRLLLDVLASSYGDADVPVVDCNAQSKYGSVHVSTEKFRDYLEYLRVKETRVGYLKDWHFQR